MTPSTETECDTQLIDISVADTSRSKYWKRLEITWGRFVTKINATVRTSETQLEYQAMSKAEQDAIKDVGGFVGGSLENGRRTKNAVQYRTLITLDADFADQDIWELFCLMLSCAGVLYTTHKHNPAKPRVRILIPLSRPVTPDEYEPVARKIASWLGIEQFDLTTYEVNRVMYWPSTSKDGEFYFKEQKGPFLNPDEVLATYSNWQDSKEWPFAKSEKASIKSRIRKQGDPMKKEGPIGALCRVYGMREAITKFLPDKYFACDVDNRFTYAGGSTSGGCIVYDDLFIFCHHATAPTSGLLCNVFDFLRINLYGHLDEGSDPYLATNEKLSFKAMVDFALKDEAVIELMQAEQQASALEDFEVIKSEETSGSILQLLLQKTASLKELASTSVHHSPPLLELYNVNVFRRGTVNLIQGKYGSHKSRLSELFISLLLSKQSSDTSFLGFSKPQLEKFSVLFIDTERSVQEEIPSVLQRIRKNAGYSPFVDPDEFYYTSIKDLPRKIRLTAIREYIAYVRKSTTCHLCIFLDVLTDCVKSFNDEAESLELMDFLGNLTDDYNCTIFSVLHENPSGVEAKARGHVGTEAANKASTVLSIGYDRSNEGKESEILKLQFLKVRSAKRPSPLFLVFDPDTGSLKMAEGVNGCHFVPADPLEQLAEQLSSILEKPKNFSELMSETRLSKNTLKQRLETLINRKTLISHHSGISHFLSVKKGPKNASIYALEPDVFQ